MFLSWGWLFSHNSTSGRFEVTFFFNGCKGTVDVMQRKFEICFSWYLGWKKYWTLYPRAQNALISVIMRQIIVKGQADRKDYQHKNADFISSLGVGVCFQGRFRIHTCARWNKTPAFNKILVSPRYASHCWDLRERVYYKNKRARPSPGKRRMTEAQDPF